MYKPAPTARTVRPGNPLDYNRPDPAFFNDSEERSLLRDACLCSTLSLCGSIFVLASWAKFRSLRVFAFRLIAYLALADIGTDTAYLMGDQATGTTGCTVQGVMRIYFNLVAIFLTTVIANLMYQVWVAWARCGRARPRTSSPPPRALLVSLPTSTLSVAAGHRRTEF